MRATWENTDEISLVQDRRIATKTHEGASFDEDTQAFYTLLTNAFTGSTLEGIVQATKPDLMGSKP